MNTMCAVIFVIALAVGHSKWCVCVEIFFFPSFEFSRFSMLSTRASLFTLHGHIAQNLIDYSAATSQTTCSTYYKCILIRFIIKILHELKTKPKRANE